jgi:AhpD family alkylhydroperoxidase
MSTTIPRLVMQEVSPKAYAAMLHLEHAVRGLGLEPSLYELVKIRASQINGCAFCIDMHTKDARAGGETEQRIYALDAWRETPFFSNRERAALALTEAVTLIADGHVPDAIYAEAAAEFDPPQLSALIMAIVAINAWNRIAITSRTVAGTYEPKR